MKYLTALNFSQNFAFGRISPLARALLSAPSYGSACNVHSTRPTNVSVIKKYINSKNQPNVSKQDLSNNMVSNGFI